MIKLPSGNMVSTNGLITVLPTETPSRGTYRGVHLELTYQGGEKVVINYGDRNFSARRLDIVKIESEFK